MKRRGLIFSLAVLLLVGGAFSAHAVSLLDNKLSISGYLQNQSSYRLGDESQWVSSENRLQVEMVARLHPNFTVAGTFRGMYDAIYDLRHDSDQWGRNYSGSRDALSTEAKMRELYVDTSLGGWDFRIGKQQVVWGESDGLRLMDIINPLDMRRQFITRDWRDIRIPQTLVKATYGIDPGSNSFLELVWNPGDVKRDKIYFDTTMNDRNKSPWTISNPPLFEKLRVDMPFALVNPAPGGGPPVYLTGQAPPFMLDTPTLRQMGILNVAEDDPPAWINVSKSEFGARLAGTMGGFFVTLNYWQGFSKSPVIKYEGGGLLGIGNAFAGTPFGSNPNVYLPDPSNPAGPPIQMPMNDAIGAYLSDAQLGPPGAPYIHDLIPGYQGPYAALLQPFPINVRLEYPRENVIGFTFNKAAGLWVWRGEFATYVNKHYNRIGVGESWSPYIGVLNNAFARGDMIVEKTLQASMLGFDYKCSIDWLNPEKMFFISGQVFNYHIFNYDEELGTGPYMQKPREDTYYLSLLINTGYHMERINPEVLVVYDASATGWYIKPRVELRYGDHWRPELGALYFAGDDQELPFGEFSQKNEVYIRLKYQF